MNFIFILLGNDSFYESIVMSKLVDQMALNLGIFCFTGSLQIVYFSENEKIYKILLQENTEENKKIFDDVIKEGEIAGIFLFDAHKAIFHEEGAPITFDLKWLENLDIPIILFDSLNAFDYNKFGQVRLKGSYEFNKKLNEKTFEEQNTEKDLIEENIEQIEKDEEIEDFILPASIYPKILKLCPQFTVPKDHNDNFLYWNSTPSKPLENEVEKMKTPLGINPNSKNVLLLFSYQLALRASILDLRAHYGLVIKTIIRYLEILDFDTNLFIIGPDMKINPDENSKVKIKNFKTITHDLYNTLMNYTDFMFIDSTWHPSLVDSANLQIPSVVIGNSIHVKEDGSMEGDFDQTDLKVSEEINKMIIESPEIFFPYISYPLKIEKLPEPTYYENPFLFYLVDIYDSKQVLPLLNEFLINPTEISTKLKERQNLYMSRSKGALTTEELFELFKQENE